MPRGFPFVSKLNVSLKGREQMNKISRSELALNDGRQGRSAYIAYKGRVYDVTDCFLWKGGRHQAMHEAGKDLTEAFDEAPHGADLLARAEMVGLLDDD